MKTYKSTFIRNAIILNHRTRFIIPIDSVLMLIGKINYTTFIMADGSQQVVSYTLKYFEPFLETQGFLRIHRGSIINPIFMNKYCQESSLLTMTNGVSMKVARTRKNALLVALKAQVPYCIQNYIELNS